jgi:hypothetical protein
MPQRKTAQRVCSNAECAKIFYVRPVDVKPGRALFCSNMCSAKAVVRKPPNGTGALSPAWKGGLTRGTRGYWFIHKPDHHRANYHGYVKRADLVAEATIGRTLRDDEIVHHDNEDKEDDSPTNLIPMTYVAHRALHAQRRHVASLIRLAAKRQPDHPVNRRPVWPADDALIALRARLSLREVARIIGCNHKAVDNRLKRLAAGTPRRGGTRK